MIYPIYSIHDALVGYQSPTIMNNDAFAMRAFHESFSDVKNAADYSLWHLADFDTDSGEIIPCTPSIVCRASDFIKETKENEK